MMQSTGKQQKVQRLTDVWPRLYQTHSLHPRKTLRDIIEQQTDDQKKVTVPRMRINVAAGNSVVFCMREGGVLSPPTNTREERRRRLRGVQSVRSMPSVVDFRLPRIGRAPRKKSQAPPRDPYLGQ
ncbi:hypothetical protein B566_EDAN013734 [Ephemera danica]|nr:hypothetical protein B566_EDAN013734 [Ephemera danica]